MNTWLKAVALVVIGILVGGAVAVGAATTTNPVTLCFRNGSMRVSADGTCTTRETKVQVASATDVAALASRMDAAEAAAAAQAQDIAGLKNRVDILEEISGCKVANLPPTLASGTYDLVTESQDAGAPNGAVGTLLSTWMAGLPSGTFSDGNDSSGCTVRGIAVTAADTAIGNWYYSLDDGAVWTPFGSPTAGAALLLSPTARVYFQPNPGANGTDSFTFLAWDRMKGTSGSTANTAGAGAGTSAFSGTSGTARITITATTS